MGGGMVMITHDDEDQEEPEPIDPSEIPTYAYEKEEVGDALINALPDMGILLFFNFLFIIGAFVSFNRYDAR